MPTNKFQYFFRTILILCAVGLAGCSGGNSDWKGDIGVEYKLTTLGHDSSTPALAAGKAVLKLTDVKDENGKDVNVLKLSSDSPLPDCRIIFFPGNAKRDTPGGVRTAVSYPVNLRFQVFTDDGQFPTRNFCVGRGGKDGEPGPVDIEDGEITIDENGSLYGVIDYRLDSGRGEKRVVSFTGSKGWF